MANNTKNLKAFTSEEARINGKKGAAKSAEVRRNKRKLKEELELLLSMEVKSPKHLKRLERWGFNEKVDYNRLINLALIMAAARGDVQAYNSIRDTTGQKEPDKVQSESTVVIVDNINEEEAEEYADESADT